MSIPVKYVFLCFIVFALAPIALVVYHKFNLDGPLQCPNLNSSYNYGDSCGYVVATSETAHWVAGFISDKKSTGDKKILVFTTADKNGNTIKETFSLPSFPMQSYITIKKKSAENPFEESRYIDAEKLFEKLEEGSEVIVTILTPSSDLMNAIIAKYGDIPFVKCYDYNYSFIRYLQSPSLLQRLFLRGDKVLKKCDLSIEQVLIYQ